MSYLYVVTMPGHPFVKIGKAINPEKRFGSIQGGNPYPLELAATIQVDRKLLDLAEAKAHQLLNGKRHSGEWFRASIEEALDAIRKGILLAENTTYTPLQRAIDLAGGQVALARLIGDGVKQQHVSSWVNHCKRLPAERAVQIERALKGAVTREELRPDLFIREDDA